MNVMPPGWMTAHWRKQYPTGTEVTCDVDIQLLWNAVPDTTYKYCPPPTAPDKTGQPKKNKHHESALEVASEKKHKKMEKPLAQLPERWRVL